jgi:hypothetical protein
MMGARSLPGADAPGYRLPVPSGLKSERDEAVATATWPPGNSGEEADQNTPIADSNDPAETVVWNSVLSLGEAASW